jgi:hypothetical protein
VDRQSPGQHGGRDNAQTGTVINQIQVGRQPHGLLYFPQPGVYSLGHNGVYR